MPDKRFRRAGDLWRQMDLHVHTPMSAETEYGNREQDSTWNKYFDALRALGPRISILGINDYWTVEGYRRVKEEFDRGNLPDVDLLIPVVELRLTDNPSNGKRQNYHVCFSNTVSVEVIEKYFLDGLTSAYKFSDGEKIPYKYNDHGLLELGRRLVNEEVVRDIQPGAPDSELSKIGRKFFAVERAEVRKLLDNEWFRSKTLEFVGYSETKQIDDSGILGLEKRHLLAVDGAFLASPSATSFRNNEDKLHEIRPDIPLIHASDAHRFDDKIEETRYLGKSDMWVRCSPNFESLSFAIRKFNERLSFGEPEDYRLKNGQTSNVLEGLEVRAPEGALSTFDYGLEINPGYTVVVGNRGQGKSALADWIAIGATTDERINFGFLNEDRFRAAKRLDQSYISQTTWKKASPVEYSYTTGRKATSNRVDYFPQARIEQLCSADPQSESAQNLESLIGDLLFRRIPPVDRHGASSLDELKDELKNQNSNSHQQGDLEMLRRSALAAINRIIEINRLDLPAKRASVSSEIKELTSDQSPSSNSSEPGLECLDGHSQLAQLKQHEDEWLSRSRDYDRRLLKSEQADEVRADTANVVKNWIDSLKGRSTTEEEGDWGSLLDGYQIQFEAYLEGWFSRLNEDLKWMRSEVRRNKIENMAILRGIESNRGRVRDQIQTEDVANQNRQRISQLRKGETDPSQDRWSLHGIDSLAREQTDREAELTKIAVRLAAIAVQSHHENLTAAQSLATLLNRTVENLDLGDGSVTVKVQVSDRFNRDLVLGAVKVKILEQMEQLCEVRKSFDSGFNELTPELVNDYMADVVALVKKVEKEGLLKKNSGVIDSLHLLQLLTDFSTFDTRVELALDGRPIPSLSPGQRGLVLLLFILEADESGNVLLIDQPEDNLDNDAIRRLLIPAIERARLKRQVIIVTHNANIGVLGDPDQVISCSYDGNVFSVSTGSITDSRIKNEMLRVLEGAEDAFRARASRYGLPVAGHVS